MLKIEYHAFKNRNFFPHKTVAGPDLQIMGGPGHSNPAKGGGGGLKTFLLFLPQFGLKIRWGGGREPGSPGPFPRSTTVKLKRSNLGLHSQEDVAD